MPPKIFSSTYQPKRPPATPKPQADNKGFDHMDSKLKQVYTTDVGCRYYPKCLECPLSECAYDEDEVEGKDGKIIMRKRISVAQVVAELEALGLPLPKDGQKRVKGTHEVLYGG